MVIGNAMGVEPLQPGDSILHTAASRKNTEAVFLLVESGVDVTARNRMCPV
jgi:hypothetical protein